MVANKLFALIFCRVIKNASKIKMNGRFNLRGFMMLQMEIRLKP